MLLSEEDAKEINIFLAGNSCKHPFKLKKYLIDILKKRKINLK